MKPFVISKSKFDLVDSLRLVNGFFQFLPFLILQGNSFWTYVPATSLLAAFFNSFGLLLLFSFEAFQWLRERQSPHSGRAFTPLNRLDALALPLLVSIEEEKEDQKKSTSSGQSPPFVSPFLWFLLPCVVLSLIPQVLSVIGIPFAWACLRRFLSGLNENQHHQQQPGTTVHFGWFEGRGYFLLFVNAFSLTFVLLFLLPWLTLLGFILAPMYSIQKVVLKRESSFKVDYQTSVHTLCCFLVFCYNPLLESLPSIKTDSTSSKEMLARWKLVIAIFWFLTFEIATLILDIVTDFQFSFELLNLQIDPLLSNKELLIASTINSFISTSIGVFFSLLQIIWIISQFGASKGLISGWEIAKKIIIVLSPFGKPRAMSWKLNLVKFIHVVGEDFLQILVACNTIGFFGRISGL
jgi:hypothetical protein